MHREAFDYLGSELLDWYLSHPTAPAVLEYGSANINGSVRDLFTADRPVFRYHGIDMFDGPGVDEVADASAYQPSWQPDIIVCAEVLEHAPDPAAIVANAHATLGPGGLFLMTCASDKRAEHSGIDGGFTLHPEEVYQRIKPADVRAWFRCFRYRHVVVGRFGLDIYATGEK